MKNLENKFVILTQPRSGSTLLVDALDRHSQIRCYREVFLKSLNGKDGVDKTEQEKKDTLHQIFDNEGVVGFKAMIVQCDPWFFEFLAKTPVKVIWLDRKDVVRQVVSTMIANITNEWFDKPVTGKYTLEPSQVIGGIRGTLKHQEWLKNTWFKRFHSVGLLSYEDLVGEEGKEIDQIPEAILTALCSTLGVENQSLPVKRKKQGKKELSDMVENWDEVLKELKANGLS